MLGRNYEKNLQRIYVSKFVYFCGMNLESVEIDDKKNVIGLIRDTVRAADAEARIFLYGSRARGTARPESDWDVVVLVSDSNSSFDKRGDIAYDLWWKGLEIGEEINAFAYSVRQWEEAPPSLFKYNVINEHIEL